MLFALLVCLTLFPRNSIGNGDSLFFQNSMVNGTDVVDASSLVFFENSKVIIAEDLDLQGKTLYLPENVVLRIAGGVISNGSVVGNHTKIEGRGKLFNKVRIEGSWDVPIINTSMFVDLHYDNSLKDVIALSNPDIHNTIIIGRGDYQVSVRQNDDTCLKIVSNTTVVLNGTIKLAANEFPNYSIVTLSGDNSALTGSGSIIGDKMSHGGLNGEWGMCLVIRGKNIKVSNLTISDAWGDCIYITGKSHNIDISNCVISNGRRQGISIISASEVHIKNCRIMNIEGTAPEYAIDVEPNRNNTVDDVLIERVSIERCKGGIMAYGRAKNSHIGRIVIKNSSIESFGKTTVYSTMVDTVEVERCYIIQRDGQKAISFDSIENLTVKNNKVSYDTVLGVVLKRGSQGIIETNKWPMIISDCSRVNNIKNKKIWVKE